MLRFPAERGEAPRRGGVGRECENSFAARSERQNPHICASASAGVGEESDAAATGAILVELL